MRGGVSHLSFVVFHKVLSGRINLALIARQQPILLVGLLLQILLPEHVRARPGKVAGNAA